MMDNSYEGKPGYSAAADAIGHDTARAFYSAAFEFKGKVPTEA